MDPWGPCLVYAIDPDEPTLARWTPDGGPVLEPPPGEVDRWVARVRGGASVLRVIRSDQVGPWAESGALVEAVHRELEVLASGLVPLRVIPPPSVGRWPLYGRRVLVTRPAQQAGSTSALLRSRGALPIEVPTIEIGPPDDREALPRAIERLRSYAAIVLTSVNGVAALFAALDDAKLDTRALTGLRIAAIGPGTAAALRSHGIAADLVANEHRGEVLADQVIADLRAAGSSAPRVLIPRAAVARDALPDALVSAGIEIDVVEAYRTRMPGPESAQRLGAVLDEGVDIVLFTASSTVEQLVRLLPDAVRRLEGTLIASIGPITSATCRRLGLAPVIEPATYTVPALIGAIEDHLSS